MDEKGGSNMIDTLEKYTDIGLYCVPVQNDKRPVKGYKWKDGVVSSAFKDAFGIGVACGEKSGNLECWDFDNHFGDAKENLSKFIADIKELYEKHQFPIESTTSGGFHLLLRCEGVEGNQKIANKPMWSEDRNRFVPDAIIETRGEGGYFVCDPTEGYLMVRGSIENIPTITTSERKEMLEAAKSQNTWHEIRKESYELTDKPGDIFNQSPESPQRGKNALRQAGWKEVRDKVWQRPDKKDGISATFGKAAENIFYCFTANGYPFEPNRGYTCFQVVALLEFGGDFSAFAKELTADQPKNDYRPKETKTPVEYEGLLKKAYIDLSIPVAKPPVALQIIEVSGSHTVEKRLFTLGNFSAITGKSKSKKTFLTTLFLTAATENKTIFDKVKGCLSGDKSGVLLFDTEQSNYDAYVTANRIPRLAGGDITNFSAFDLREYSPLERCEIIAFALEKYGEQTGYVVIDGVADLAKSNNDEEEATRVVSLLMKWSKIYNCHISTIIHQNKQDNYATGHLGSAILKKAECVISVTKDAEDNRKSRVSCDLIRGTSDFNDFDIEIDGNGLPKIGDKSKETYTVIQDKF